MNYFFALGTILNPTYPKTTHHYDILRQNAYGIRELNEKQHRNLQAIFAIEEEQAVAVQDPFLLDIFLSVLRSYMHLFQCRDHLETGFSCKIPSTYMSTLSL
jgi:hypothetical protein